MLCFVYHIESSLFASLSWLYLVSCVFFLIISLILALPAFDNCHLSFFASLEIFCIPLSYSVLAIPKYSLRHLQILCMILTCIFGVLLPKFQQSCWYCKVLVPLSITYGCGLLLYKLTPVLFSLYIFHRSRIDCVIVLSYPAVYIAAAFFTTTHRFLCASALRIPRTAL